MERIYLEVPPEEYAEVQSLGASWEEHSKRWYIASSAPPAEYSRWLASDGEDPEFGIASEKGMVACAQASCQQCQAMIAVICIYCESGTDAVTGDSMQQFTLSNIWAVDGSLARQLSNWPYFKRVNAGSEETTFANFCPHCHAKQEDYLLHDEPGDVFFGISPERSGSVKFTPLSGTIQLSGDYSFEV